MKYKIFIATMFFSFFGKAQHKNTGFIDFNGYYDTREFSEITFNLLANLDHRFQYFSLTNFTGKNRSSDIEQFYSEQNLRWRIKDTSSFDLTLQYVMRNQYRNDDWKLGFRWRLHNFKPFSKLFKAVHFKYSANPMIFQFREATESKYFTQIEHVYRLNIAPEKTNNRIYIAGFWDQLFFNDNNKISFQHVSEHQLGIRLVSQLYIVTEYRINTFFESQQTGLGYGIEYKMIF